MPVKGAYLAIAGGGAILLWSGLRGKSWSTVLRDLISGKNPASAPAANSVSSVSSSASTSLNPQSAVTPSSTSQKAWITAFLASLGAPPTTANVNSIASWMARESPWNSQPPDGGLYTNNPLNVTEQGFGSVSSVNSAGVRIYPSQLDGIMATVAVITSGNYSAIVSALRAGEGICGGNYGQDFSTWSGGGYSSVC
jgi:hypothetical protein